MPPLPHLPGDGAQDGLLMLITQMPHLVWAWLIVLLACNLFTMVDNRKVFGIPQLIYTLQMIAIFLLRGVETHSTGYYIIWALGGGGLAIYLLIKGYHQTADAI